MARGGSPTFVTDTDGGNNTSWWCSTARSTLLCGHPSTSSGVKRKRDIVVYHAHIYHQLLDPEFYPCAAWKPAERPVSVATQPKDWQDCAGTVFLAQQWNMEIHRL